MGVSDKFEASVHDDGPENRGGAEDRATGHTTENGGVMQPPGERPHRGAAQRSERHGAGRRRSRSRRLRLCYGASNRPA